MFRHFSEARKKIEPTFFSDKIYSQILDSLVIACTDAYFICGNKVLLTRRSVYPRKDYWAVGGRMISGEDPRDSLRRIIKQETGLDIETKRLQFFGVYSTGFAKRKQAPAENGAQTLNLCFSIKISASEKNKIKLIDSEYSAHKWVELDAIELTIDKNDYFLYILNDLKNSLQ